MSDSIGGSGKVPFSHKDFQSKEDIKQPKEGEEGHVKKVANLGKRIKDDYIEKNTNPTDYHWSGLQGSNAGQKDTLGEVDITSDPPEDLPPQLDDMSENPTIIQDQPKPSITHERLPSVAKDVLGSTISNRPVTNRPAKTHQETELANNPLMMKMRKKAEYEGEIKQDAGEARAQQEFADKAKGLGYRFDTDFEMYLPIQDGTKEALTKEEMAAMMEGKVISQTSAKPKEVKYEGRTSELDAFASKDSLQFNEEMGMYISSNGDKFATIDEIKEQMTSSLENKTIDEIAKKQGYSPYPGMEGVYINEDGDIKAADDFKR